MKEANEIIALYNDRKSRRSPLIQRMVEVRDAYNGDLVIPLPDLNEEEKSAVPNLIGQGVDQTGMRIASTLPNMVYHPTKPGFKNSEESARLKRKVNLAWWQYNKMGLKLRRRARWLIAYACSPVVIRPDRKIHAPKWELRDPLSTYPAPETDPDSITPPDVIFSYTQTYQWLKLHYPIAAAAIRRPEKTRRDELFTILEYIDDEQNSLIAFHPDASEPSVIAGNRGRKSIPTPKVDRQWGFEQVVEVERTVNKAGICTAVVPGRITLDREQGQYDGIIGMYQAQSLLFALEFRAVASGIWPDLWLQSRPGEKAEIITAADGRKGIIGEVAGGEIRPIEIRPGYMTNSMIDRLERYARTTAGIPPEFGGESSTNIRTGRRGEQVLSAVADFPVQEAQELLAQSLHEEDKRAIAIDKAYFGNGKKSFYVSWKGNVGPAEYTPNDLFDTDNHSVFFPFAGTDINGLIVGLGQRLGIGTISTRTAMELDPFIDDAELESDRIESESLLRALRASIEQQASQGAIPPNDLARIAELVITNKMDLPAALMKAQEEAQERQSTTEQPVEPGAPEAMPGLASPGMGAEAGVAPPPGAVPGGGEDLQALTGLLSQLHVGNMAAKSAQNGGA